MKGIVSCVASERVLKAFPLEPHVVSTGHAASATRQTKFSTLEKAVRHYDVPLLRSQMLQTHRHTHTQNISISILDIGAIVSYPYDMKSLRDSRDIVIVFRITIGRDRLNTDWCLGNSV